MSYAAAESRYQHMPYRRTGKSGLLLRHPGMTSALIGASRVEQLEDAVGALQRLDFSAEELSRIDDVLR